MLKNPSKKRKDGEEASALTAEFVNLKKNKLSEVRSSFFPIFS